MNIFIYELVCVCVCVCVCVSGIIDTSILLSLLTGQQNCDPNWEWTRFQKSSFPEPVQTKEIVSLRKEISLKAFRPDSAPAQISFLLALWWTTHMEMQASCAWFEFKLLLTWVENSHKLSSGFLPFLHHCRLISDMSLDIHLESFMSSTWQKTNFCVPLKRDWIWSAPPSWSSEHGHFPAGAGEGWSRDGGGDGVEMEVEVG